MIAPGLAADLVVLPGNLRDDPGQLSHPSAVFVGGRQVVSDGWLAPPFLAAQAEAVSSAQRQMIAATFEGLD